ncbi:MAG: IS630 family transposase [Thermoplasmataceae archaeon]
MPRKAVLFQLAEKDRLELERIAHSGKEEHRIVWRAQMLLACDVGKRISDIASEFRTRPNTVIKWRDRYLSHGIGGIYDAPRSGKPKVYPADLVKRILDLIGTSPPPGHATWNGPLIADSLGVSRDKVWNILRKEGIQLQRQRSWCISTDPEFSVKSADIVGLYLDPPENAIIISVDEKPGIQALQRKTGYVYADSGKIVRAYRSTYKRNGTLNLFAALEVASGSVSAKTTGKKTRSDFLAFMDDVVKDHEGREIHVILDNYCTHKRCDAWLEQHKKVHFHYTLTSASWLNQVEIWFSIFGRTTLKGASFESTDALASAVTAYVSEYNLHPKPFKWKKREVRGSQIRDTIANLRN